jgi:phosphatidylserine decarboxylase
MSGDPIRFINRKTKTLETEKVLGEALMRLLYESIPGRLALHLLIKRAFVSWYYGWKMNMRHSANKVLPFVVEHNLDTQEFVKSPFLFKTFNEFFARALKPEARPIAPGDEVAVLPADGRHLAFQNVDLAQGFYVKGEKFSLPSLFGENKMPESQRELSLRYRDGSMIISRLAPVDYHRFHFPVAGVPSPARLINGVLFSVSPIALRRNVSFIVKNKRMITAIESPVFGRVLMMEIGATMVGSIRETFPAGMPVAKGEEKGLFKFGGSCVITFFEPGRLLIDQDLVLNTEQGLETYAKMGESMGKLRR